MDTLTEIANRMKFDEVLKYSVDRAKRYNIELSVILFDIDNFKKVNDTYGHLIGDDVGYFGTEVQNATRFLRIA